MMLAVVRVPASAVKCAATPTNTDARSATAANPTMTRVLSDLPIASETPAGTGSSPSRSLNAHAPQQPSTLGWPGGWFGQDHLPAAASEWAHPTVHTVGMAFRSGYHRLVRLQRSDFRTDEGATNRATR